MAVPLSLIDPIPHAQELITQQRYAEADEYLRFFMSQESYQNNHAMNELAAKVTEQRQQLSYQASKIFEGITSGHSDELEGEIAGVISDLLVIGDIRDLSVEGWNWWQDKEVDKVILALSSIGVAATAGSVATAGSSNVVKPVITFLKVAQKLGKIPLWLREFIMTAKVSQLSSDILKSLRMCGGVCTLKMLNLADNAGDFQRSIPIATQLGKNANVFFEIAGKEGLKVKNLNTALLAATYKDGVKVLNRIGEAAFLARVTKIGYKHFDSRYIPSYLLIAVMILCVLTWRKRWITGRI